MKIQSNSDSSERIWKFLHGEMETDERAAFAESVRVDPQLASELRAQRQLHLLLVNAGRDALVDRLLEEYEAEETMAPPAPCKGRRLDFPGRSTLLALAACAVVVAGLFWAMLPRGPLRWDPPQVIATAYRKGDEPAPPGKYTKEELLNAARRLMREVDRAAREVQDPALEELSQLSLRLSIEEIFAGQVFISVEIPGREAWDGNLPSLNDLLRRAPLVAGEILDHLRARPNRPSP